MTSYVDLWQLLAGLGLFLFAMQQLEEALTSLGGRSFKTFLKTNTRNPFKGLFSGVLLTALLQSSSAVSLLLLAFVGAGILSLRQALPVIFGSNLGTTATGWLVVSLGFKLAIEAFALPFIGLGGVIFFFFRHEDTYFNIGRFLLSFGLIFLGLDFMKASVELLAQTFNPEEFTGYSHFAFFVIGFLLTALIQSSSATMVIALSVLNSGLITPTFAMAIVAGANVGTTVTVLIGSLGGIPAKKQVASAHFLFNMVSASLAMLLLNYFHTFIFEILGIQDPLLKLVLFHTLFNLMGVLLFFPFNRPLGHLLEKFFQPKKVSINRYLHLVPPQVAEAAIEALLNEVDRLISISLFLNLKALGLTHEKLINTLKSIEREQSVKVYRLSYPKGYQFVKQLEGEMLGYYAEIQKQILDSEEAEKLNRLMQIMQNTMHAVKGIKDIKHNILDFDSSPSELLHERLHQFRESTRQFYEALLELLLAEAKNYTVEEQAKLMMIVQQNYELSLKSIYEKIDKRTLDTVSVSTLFNVNRELYSSHKAILLGISERMAFPVGLPPTSV